MGTTAQKLQNIIDSKADISAAIESRGLTVPALLREYADMIRYLTKAWDAKVEYLETSGTQYIDTEITPGNNEVEWELSCDNTRPSSGSDGLFGSRQTTTAYTSGSYNIFAQSVNLRLDCTSRGSAVYTNPSNPILIKFDSAYTTVNGVAYYNGTKGQCDYSLCIFAINTAGSITASGSMAKGKIYYCKIWKNQKLVRDFIPVRVGQVGYLFDRVSGRMFGNAGSGSFTLGADI